MIEWVRRVRKYAFLSNYYIRICIQHYSRNYLDKNRNRLETGLYAQIHGVSFSIENSQGVQTRPVRLTKPIVCKVSCSTPAPHLIGWGFFFYDVLPVLSGSPSTVFRTANKTEKTSNRHERNQFRDLRRRRTARAEFGQPFVIITVTRRLYTSPGVRMPADTRPAETKKKK